MTNDDFQLLQRAHAIIAGMPREFAATRAAHAMARAAATRNTAEAQAALLASGVLDIAAVLASAAYTLRATGHFASAQVMDEFAQRIRDWERRDQPRQAPRRSNGGSGAA